MFVTVIFASRKDKYHTWLQIPVRQDGLHTGIFLFWYCGLHSVWLKRLFCWVCVCVVSYSTVRNRRLHSLIESGCLVKASRLRRCYKKRYWCLSRSRSRSITSLCRISKKKEKICKKRKLKTVLICQQGISCLVSWGAKVFVYCWWVYNDSTSLLRKYCFIGLNVTEHL